MAESLPDIDGLAANPVPRDALGRFLYHWSVLSALGGCGVLLLICAVSVWSVVGRALWSQPLLGDVELVQMGCALAIASFLPYCQLKNGHVIVDFFTQHASPRLRAVLDAVAALLLAAVALLLAWRSTVGALEMAHSGESSMILGWPLWWFYLTLGPGFLLLALCALYTARQHWQGATA